MDAQSSRSKYPTIVINETTDQAIWLALVDAVRSTNFDGEPPSEFSIRSDLHGVVDVEAVVSDDGYRLRYFYPLLDSDIVEATVTTELGLHGHCIGWSIWPGYLDLSETPETPIMNGAVEALSRKLMSDLPGNRSHLKPQYGDRTYWYPISSLSWVTPIVETPDVLNDSGKLTGIVLRPKPDTERLAIQSGAVIAKWIKKGWSEERVKLEADFMIRTGVMTRSQVDQLVSIWAESLNN